MVDDNEGVMGPAQQPSAFLRQLIFQVPIRDVWIKWCPKNPLFDKKARSLPRDHAFGRPNIATRSPHPTCNLTALENQIS